MSRCRSGVVPGIALMGVALVAIGCVDGAGDAAGEIVMDTLPNGAVRVQNPETGLWDHEQRWHARLDLRIGAMEGDGPDLFGDVRGVTVDAAGRVYVLDGLAREVRVFDRSGGYLGTLGAAGAGPGEFTGPNGIAAGPDGTIWVSDPGGGRYSVFDTAGSYLRSFSRTVDGFGFHWEGVLDDRGRIMDPSRSANRTQLVRHDIIGDALVPVDSFPLPSASGPETTFQIDGEGGSRLFLSIPFAPGELWAYDGDDGLWIASGDHYRIYHRSFRGDTLRIVERARSPDRVTEADAQRAIEDQGGRERLGTDAIRELRSRIPDTKPHFSALLTDEQGFLWVARSAPGVPGERSSSSQSVFDIFDPEGRFLGELEVPIGLRPLPRVVGTSLVGVLHDEFEVPHVVVYRLEGREEEVDP